MGLTSLLSLPSELLPEESLGQIFRAVLDPLVAYKEQVAETTKGDEDDDFDDDLSDDEEFQSPIDNVDSFVFFSETMKVMSISDPRRFQNLTQSMEFHYQAVANVVARHAEERRVEIEKEKAEKATSVVAQQ